LRLKEGNILTYSEAVAYRISQICKERNLTLNKLASLSGLRQSTLDNIAKGNTKNPTLRTLHRIAVGLDMTVSQLLDYVIMNESVFDDE
jgi:transcriptional regulator with XRE-family HTH domain